jgi:hypothetical protein
MGSRTHFCNIILDTTPISRQNVRKVDDHIYFARTAIQRKTCLKSLNFAAVCAGWKTNHARNLDCGWQQTMREGHM